MKVRLILAEGNEHFEASEQFQFHEGSINTFGPSLKCIPFPVFQFREGSINTYLCFRPHCFVPISIP